MSREPRLLDAYCGAGGAAKGYQRAGFHVTGVDNRPQPHYVGDDFVQADALEVSRRIPYALVYRVRDRVTGRRRRTRRLLRDRAVAERLAALMAQWPEFSDVEIVTR